MNLSLTPQLEEMIQQKVATGRYNNASEVVREALRLMEERDQEREVRLRELRAAIQEGIDSGQSRPLDMEQLIREAHNEREVRLSSQKS